jgi:hypothetical protein
MRISADNKFVYLLNELTATVTTLSIDPKTGVLTEVSSASALPPDSKLVPGMPRGAIGTPGANQAPSRHHERHLGLRPAPHAERQVPLRRGAHQQLARRLQRGRRDRQAHVPRQHGRPSRSRAASPSIRPAST